MTPGARTCRLPARALRAARSPPGAEFDYPPPPKPPDCRPGRRLSICQSDPWNSRSEHRQAAVDPGWGAAPAVDGQLLRSGASAGHEYFLRARLAAGGGAAARAR